MISSIYTRVVLTFLVFVIGGTIIAFFVATWVFKDQLNENLQVTLLDFGQDVVRIYETFPLREADSFVSGMKQLNSYHIRIYDETGQFQSYGKLYGCTICSNLSRCAGNLYRTYHMKFSRRLPPYPVMR